MRTFLCAALCLVSLPLCAQVREQDGFIRVDTREEVERAPRDATRVRASKLTNADLGTLVRFERLKELDLRCSTALTDAGLNAMQNLPAHTVIDLRGCTGISASALAALIGNPPTLPLGTRVSAIWLPAELADGRLLRAENRLCELGLGTDQGVHKGQRFECFSADIALGGVFTGVVEVTEAGKATSKAAILYEARGQSIKPDQVLVNRIWRGGRYLNFVLAGEFEPEMGVLSVAEILDTLEELGARSQERQWNGLPLSVELVIGGANLLGDDAYRTARDQMRFAFVSEKGLRLYLDSSPGLHSYDPMGVAHVPNTAALKRCLPGQDAIQLDVLDNAGAELMAQWKLNWLQVDAMSGVSAESLGKLIKAGVWRHLALSGACTGNSDIFEGVTFSWFPDYLGLEGTKAPDGKWQGPPITAGLLKRMYTTTEEDRASFQQVSFRHNPGLTAATTKLLPTWWRIDVLDVSECSGLDDAAVRELIAPTTPDHTGIAQRETRKITLAGNPQLTDACFDVGAPESEYKGDRTADISGCSGLTDLALQRLATVGYHSVLISRKDKFTEAGIKAVSDRLTVRYVEDLDKPIAPVPVQDDGKVVPVPAVYVVRDEATLASLPASAKRVRLEGDFTTVPLELADLAHLVELDLSGCQKLTELPQEWWPQSLRRLDLRGCKGIYTSELGPLSALNPLKDQAGLHLWLDGAHLFAPETAASEADLAKASAYVEAWHTVAQARANALHTDSLSEEQRNALEEKLRVAEENWLNLKHVATYEPALSRAITAGLEPKIAAFLDQYRAAGAKWVATPDSVQAQSEYLRALACLNALAESAEELCPYALSFDASARKIFDRFEAMRKEYDTQVTDLEKKWDAATGDAATELLRQVEATKDLKRELEGMGDLGGKGDYGQMVQSLQGFKDLRSLRVEKAGYWRSSELVAVATAVQCKLELDLSGNANLTDADIDVLITVRRLAWVNLKGCKGISKAALDRLAEMRPGTKIER
ncbi:MAG: hypothetical protein IPP14_02225 [Planctomycetes bacterium]|nr:hypothetical protein [Planctomycetota bacterium]